MLLLPAAALVWLAAATVGAVLPSGGGTGPAPGAPGVTVHLWGTAIHYDLLLPATPETRAAFAFAAPAGVPVDDPGAAWILAGWGARDFYTATGTYADMRPGPVWRAATGDASVLRVDVVGAWTPPGPAIRLSPDGYARLLAAVAATRAGDAPLPHAGFTATDAFFPAAGRFHLLDTCNAWVGRMLRAAGLRFGRWTPTPGAVRLSLRLWQGGGS